MQWIDTPQALEAFLQPALEEGRIALDTEFLRTDTYWPRLCLIQLARVDGSIALVDPLVCDLAPLRDALAISNLTWVLHAGWQDLELLWQTLGVLPARLFDTQTAAILHGFGEQAGLAALLEALLNIRLPKDATRSNWCQRPLSEKQQTYAANDVRHLLTLHERLSERLAPAALHALEEDFADMLDPMRYEQADESAWLRLPGGWKLSAKQQTLLRALATWRERTARARNQPRRWIMSDDTLMALARRPAASLEKLRNVPGLSAPQWREHGEAIMQVLDETFAAADWRKENSPRLRPQPQEEPLLSLARAVIQQQALDFHIRPGAFDTHTLLEWLRHRQGPLGRGWRRLLLGEPLARIQSGTPLSYREAKLEVPHAPIFRD